MSYNDVVIDVQNVSKFFRTYATPFDRLKQFFIPKMQRLLGVEQKHYFHEFCALNDISFQIKKGQCLGIIGHNGSGKSTLLQVICGTLSENTGSVSAKGKIAALLELGSGFNPEFTGRENVFLNAMLLGLTREQTEERFDQIVDFADIGDFLDQPVKTYSSGMVVRLAFAVIAHVDAEILIIDEALAVGDAVFVQKCMRFIRNFKEKNTLLFVSHDSTSVQNLCDNAIWLDHGRVREYGPAKQVVEAYIAFNHQKIAGEHMRFKKAKSSIKDDEVLKLYETENKVKDNLQNTGGFGTGLAKIESAKFFDRDGNEKNLFSGGENLILRIEASTSIDMDEPIIGFFVNDRLGQNLFGESSLYYTGEKGTIRVVREQKLVAEFSFKMPYLASGKYVVCVAIAEGTQINHVQHDYLFEALVFDVIAKSSVSGLVGIEFENIILKNEG